MRLYLYSLPNTPETMFALDTGDEMLRNLPDSFTVIVRNEVAVRRIYRT